MILREFLVKAKIFGYATGGESGERRLPDGGKEFEFESEGFRYRDIYYGFNPFAGQELVWHKEQIIWTMNYYGAMTSDKIAPQDIYKFLKKAMVKIELDRPFRGPNSFSHGKFSYQDKSFGDINGFKGRETISIAGNEVYYLVYHGGLINDE
jgi:hypothetical protein